MDNKKRAGFRIFVWILAPVTVLFLRAAIPEAGMVTWQGGTGQAAGGAARTDSGMGYAEPVRYRYIKDCPLSGRIQREIFETCTDADVSFEFVMALIEKESSFDPECVSDEGQSVGLMQVQEKWHREIMDRLGCPNLYDPVQNVRVGVYLLRVHLVEYQDAAAALMAYNGGRAYADRQLEQGQMSGYATGIIEKTAEYERENGLWEK